MEWEFCELRLVLLPKLRKLGDASPSLSGVRYIRNMMGNSEASRRTMKRVAVIVLAALAVCVLAVTLAVVLVPSLSWADVLAWVTTTPPCEGPCD